MMTASTNNSFTNNSSTNRFSVVELPEIMMYKIITEDNELIGNILTSKQEAITVCNWLNSLEYQYN